VPATVVPFGEWKPDLADTPDHLKAATNVRAIANGYAPVRSFNAMTPTLAGDFQGGGAFVDSTGTTHFVAAKTDDFLTYSGTGWSGHIGGLATTRRWYFAQFGDNLAIANGGALIRYRLTDGTYTNPTDAPTNAIDVAAIGDFVVALTDDHQVKWSEFNNLDEWTGGENQADNQPLLDGGPGVRIAGGEYGLIFQKECIRRMQYVGGDAVFQFDKISPEIGIMAAGSLATIGRLSFFLSERGFQMCNGVEVTPIGDEKFNRWFFSTYSREDIANIWAAVNPRTSEVMWAMPGTPGKVICYNWVLGRPTMLELEVSGMFNGFTANVSIDALDALYPTGLDDIPLSLDDPAFNGGNPLLLIVNADDEIGTLSGDYLEASLTVPCVEPTPGRRSRIRSIRLVGDPTEAEITVDARMRRGDAESIRTAGSMRLNGKCNIRSNGRFNDVTVVIPSHDWDDVQGVEIEFEAGDGR
jgi:hypothetical protein